MAAACIFSLAQSAELCPDIAESGTADLALEDLANGGRPGQGGQKESEFLLAQLAVVAQVIIRETSGECLQRVVGGYRLNPSPRSQNRQALSPADSDAIKPDGEFYSEYVFLFQKLVGRILLLPFDVQVAFEPRFCRRLASPETVDLLIMLALGTAPENKREQHGPEKASDYEGGGGGGGWKNKGSERVNGGDNVDRGGGYGEPRRAGSAPVPSGEKVNVITPYVGALRYCVVTIVERLGSILDDGGEFERMLSALEMDSIVVSPARRMQKLFSYRC